MTQRVARPRGRHWCAVATAAAAALCGTLLGPAAPTAAALGGEPAPPALYLVTLDQRALVHRADDRGLRQRLERSQDAVLAAVDAPPPLYRWTSALNGMAVKLTGQQAHDLATVPGVATVEQNSVRTLAGSVGPTTSATALGHPGSRRGGAGVVIGIVDSGLDPDSPLFAAVPDLGRAPGHFHGSCETSSTWPVGACNRKVVGARWFVAGFGSSAVRSSSSMSPRDDDGHGTLVASVAAGNSGVSVKVGSQRLGAYSGTAPQARLAVYKACWAAPDPDHDGCATADLVTAIDRATADGVDVLNLSIAGGAPFDTVDRALLGATVGGATVIGAAGNEGRSRFAAHPSPWVTSVGAFTGRIRGGRLALGSGPVLHGAMSSKRTVSGRLVLAGDIAAPDARVRDARLCLPGSLDAAQAAGAVVLCERGGIGRVDKSQTVALADGVGMVLANGRGNDLHADFQQVPTVHLSRADADLARAWQRTHSLGEVTLSPGEAVGGAPELTAWSAPGNPRGDLVKPDVTAAGVDVLGAIPATDDTGARWNHFSGTSAAAAKVTGQAALLRSRHPAWSPARVHSALLTTARAVAGDASPLHQGAGRTRTEAASRPGLVYDLPVRDYERYLAGRVRGRNLNLPSLKLDGAGIVRRTLTSVAHRARYYSVRTTGFTEHRVRVTPAAIRIGPGERRTFRVVVTGPLSRTVDTGWVVWRGTDGTRVRIPVVIGD